ncbi:glycosyltransferase [Colwellia sp. MEBiC06753]
MAQNNPLVTVYIPTHNRLALLKRALASVLKQTYTNIELIVVNDGSTDGTFEYLETLDIPSITLKVFHQPNAQGACAARNIAIAHASGQFITGLDDDDEFTSDRLANFIKYYDENYAFVCTGFYWHYGKKARLVDHKAMVITLGKQLDYNYATNQVFVNTERLKAIGGFDETFLACQDYDTWTRLIQKFGPAKRISGASYIIHRGDEVERISASENWLKGHQQFLTKFSNVMSRRNCINQEFKSLSAKRQVYPLFRLVNHLRYGLVLAKLRYWLSSNFTNIAALRRKTLE